MLKDRNAKSSGVVRDRISLGRRYCKWWLEVDKTALFRYLGTNQFLMTTPRNRTEACPIEEFMDMLRGRWKVFILWELIQAPRRSGELRKSIPPITQKVFVEQLRDLEDNGLVKRTVFPTVPPRVEYEVTELGQSLRGILKDMCHWSSANMEKIRECRRTRRLELVEK
jgi:DNA-binding HxlR family transcriptional regulator